MNDNPQVANGLSPDRVKGIGGSEAAAVLGLSKWTSPYEIWCAKVGVSEKREASAAMEWGNLLEPVIRQKYSDVTGRTVRNPGHMQSAMYPWMLCTPDGLTDDGRVVEIKTTAFAQEWGEPGTDDIPQAYVIQCQHNMFVAELPVADVPVLIGGRDFRIYEVQADPELQAMLVEREGEFWQMVEARTPPPPITYADAIQRWAASRPETVVATPEVLAAVEAYREAGVTGKAADQRAEEAKFAILLVLAEADTLVDTQGNTLLTYKQSKDGTSFDRETFEKTHPDLFRQFLVPKVGSRRLLVKAHHAERSEVKWQKRPT